MLAEHYRQEKACKQPIRADTYILLPVPYTRGSHFALWSGINYLTMSFCTGTFSLRNRLNLFFYSLLHNDQSFPSSLPALSCWTTTGRHR